MADNDDSTDNQDDNQDDKESKGGAAGGSDTSDQDSKDSKDSKDDNDTSDLGEGGKKALESERAARREADKRAKAAEKRAQEAEAERERLQRESMSEQDKAIAKARDDAAKEIRDELTGKYKRQLVEATVAAKAAGRFAIGADKVVRLLDLDEIQIDDDGSVDSDAISKALDDLLEAEPQLKAGAKPGTTPSADGGARPPDKDKKYDIEGRLERIQERTRIK